MLNEETDEIRRALGQVSLFSDVLSPAQLDDLARECQSFFFPPGSILMGQGDPSASMYCITDGVVSIRVVLPDGARREIRQIGAGSVVGEIELLTGERRIATVTAVTYVRALEISKSALEAAFAKAPDLIDAFASVLAIRQAMLQQIAHEHGGPLHSRIVRQIRGAFSRKHDADELL
jgi:CRP-like cAMP-binding protein